LNRGGSHAVRRGGEKTAEIVRKNTGNCGNYAENYTVIFQDKKTIFGPSEEKNMKYSRQNLQRKRNFISFSFGKKY